MRNNLAHYEQDDKMTEEKKKQETDYFGRLNRLTESESKEWFKCDEGKYKILFTSEGTPFEQEWEGETIPKLRFDIIVDDKEYSLSVTEGQTKQSFYGQLMLIATKTEPINQLAGKTITLVVTGSGKKKRYTVLESVGLEKGEKPEIEEVQVA